MHDKAIDRPTSGNGEVIDYSLEEIKTIPTIGEYNGQTLSEEIPTLVEIIATFTDTEHLTLLYSKGEFDLKDALFSPYPFIGIESTDVKLDVVNELHHNGKEVHVYFTDKETQKNEQERIKAFNVDGYFTDYIEYTK